MFNVYDIHVETSKIDHDFRADGQVRKPRSKTVNIRFNNTEHKRIFATAYKQGKTVSEMIRYYVMQCLDSFEEEFGKVSWEGKKESNTIKLRQVNPKDKPATIEECIALTLQLDEDRIKQGWSEGHRINSLKLQSDSADPAMAHAAVIVYQQRKAEKAKLSKDNAK